jgi:hypothetical protein
MLDFTPVMDRVYTILKEFPDARNDDKVLNCEFLLYWHGIHTFRECIGNHAVPQCKTIERCRREVQRYCKDVAADPKITAFRRKNERDFFKELKRQGIAWAVKRNLQVFKKSDKIISRKERTLIEKDWRREYYGQAPNEVPK